MTQNNYTTTPRKFNHLSNSERGEIKALLREGFGVNAIACKIGRNKSTVSREIKRGTVCQLNSELVERLEYFADTGEKVYKKRRENSRKCGKLVCAAEFIAYADEQMRNHGWSPDAIVGRAKIDSAWAGKPLVCTKTLYNYIDKGLLKTRNIDLLIKVRLKSKTKRTRKNKKILGTSIEQRPTTVEMREEFGHWEGDSVIGRKKDQTALSTLVERKTRFQIAIKISDRKAETTKAIIMEKIRTFASFAPLAFRSVTVDNGNEFSTLSGLSEEQKDISVYFAHPYSSFERGTNERHNGLLRRFIKKGASIDDMSPEFIELAVQWNNNLPRRILGYRTPAEVFADEIAQIASQVV